MITEPKANLKRYLDTVREALLWKLDGVGERDLRLPRTPTGTNLLGIVRHVANVEIGYFGPTFGRAWPEPDHPLVVDDADYDADPQADWWVPAEVSAAEVVAFYRQVMTFSDATIADLPLEATGSVPWWSDGEVTLHQVVTHVIVDLARHAGHADILREAIDGAAGLRVDVSNLPDGVDWPAYVARLRLVAEQFPAG
ncbi:DinB family protein [Nocardioides sp.]|uniref:DinB family protein n=1 Tax=Nocardioides sp. TaxID=35761 RepID=UPI0035B30B46